MTAEKLASLFYREYFKDRKVEFPVDPFKMLSDLNVHFVLKPFKKYDGIFIPADNEDDNSLVAININRPIVRQRFSAAHELCHFLKDSQRQLACIPNSSSSIEKYAENFASEILMPTQELKNQVSKYEKNGYIDLDSVLTISNYFGVSFLACLFKIAYRLHKVKGDTDPTSLRNKAKKFKPDLKRKERNLTYTKLYSQLIDALPNTLNIAPIEYTKLKFKTEYVFHDSRMEGIDIDEETAAQIVVDLALRKQESIYCTEKNQNIIEVAGLSLAYDYVFEEFKNLITIYDAKYINEKLYSTAPHPECGGLFRQSNTFVTGAKFEAVDCALIPEKWRALDKEIEKLLNDSDKLSISQYIKRAIQIHYRLTVIHPFNDGNGRTSRAFLNMLLLKKNIYPVFFIGKQKDTYKEALMKMDTSGEIDLLYECFIKSMLQSTVILSDYQL